MQSLSLGQAELPKSKNACCTASTCPGARGVSSFRFGALVVLRFFFHDVTTEQKVPLCRSDFRFIRSIERWTSQFGRWQQQGYVVSRIQLKNETNLKGRGGEATASSCEDDYA